MSAEQQPTPPRYALFQNGKQISKAHSTIRAGMMEAYECSAVIDWAADWSADRPGRGLADGYEIREVANG